MNIYNYSNRRIIIGFILTVFINNNLGAQKTINDKLMLTQQQDKHWWVGIINHGDLMPLTNDYNANMYGNNFGNQIQPLLLSKSGEYIWSDHPIDVLYSKDTLVVQSFGGEIVYSDGNQNLREAYLDVSSKFFKPSGMLPDLDLIRFPQYNTWIELMYDQNQEDILKYANAILENDFPPGVIMVDDNWQEDYGNWKFHPARFPNPKEMMDSLHNMGFKVMLWACPFISADSYIHRDLSEKGYLLKDSTGNPAIIHWWNGYSSCIDFSHPQGYKWFDKQLETLVNQYDVDGFKLDAGDAKRYNGTISYQDIGPNEQSRLYGEIGLNYPLNEYRAMWKMGGQPLVQRLRDKGHDWQDLQKLIPHILLQGIMGYSFTCPDMIGGGEYRSFLNTDIIDQELIVRSAQCHALMPMMQFSVAPWRILDNAHLEACKEAINIREQYISTILKLAKESANTGEPIVRSMEYVFPNEGYENVKDQFMLGNDIMVCPVLTKNCEKMVITIPKGRWKSDLGMVYRGEQTVEILTPLNRLPLFEKITKN